MVELLLQRWLTRSREEELAVVVFGLVAAVVRRRKDGGAVLMVLDGDGVAGCVSQVKGALLFVVAGRREGAVEMEVEVSGELQWWPARRWRRRLPWWVEGKLGLGFHV
ncbi:hypothetical protein DEO72_LG4g797 [Vigna unguiculata]|uniref:Uncharacterized protein n=1 Tax=Vigna unguiculata TaxID=3917 RepID=A0A4D6LMP1_VIGUN|nr:hypothetical protein DEO72_LG4g797 [Vigna unguiculata]